MRLWLYPFSALLPKPKGGKHQDSREGRKAIPPVLVLLEFNFMRKEMIKQS